MNIAQAVLVLIILGLMGAGAWVMDFLFGLVGVGFFALFMAPMLAFVYWIIARSDGGGGGASTGTNRRQSKGARSED